VLLLYWGHCATTVLLLLCYCCTSVSGSGSDFFWYFYFWFFLYFWFWICWFWFFWPFGFFWCRWDWDRLEIVFQFLRNTDLTQQWGYTIPPCWVGRWEYTIPHRSAEGVHIPPRQRVSLSWSLELVETLHKVTLDLLILVLTIWIKEWYEEKNDDK
jgi:hypothetical protein